MIIEKDKVVYMHYTLKNKDGEVLDSSIDSEPLAYIHGNGYLIAGLEEELEGKKANDSIKAVISPEKAYGEYREGQISAHSRDDFDNAEKLEIGMQVHAETDDGIISFTVTEINDKEVKLDANHPLAGETLYFDVTVVNVRKATSEELDHGHVH
ncbi:MAG: peptidylprolyl isomerase [Spirochaetales bacterium]|nr:peptidylprolyl isomerase [Spirochaetales bacterium]